MRSPQQQKLIHAGFTIVELLVTISIVVLVTGLIMIRYSSFNSSVLLSGQAYLTAFDIREAQSLAVSVRGNHSEFKEEYGIYFDLTSPTEYILFQDDDTNSEDSPAQYPGERSSEPYSEDEGVGAPLRVDSRFRILDLCTTTGGTETCSINNLAITFKRPDFDADFFSTEAADIEAARVVIGSNDSEITRSVVVYSSGQISVE